MPESIRISRVRFTAASEDATCAGLMGHVQLVLNDSLIVDGIGLRKTLDGRITLSWPARRDRFGRRHFSVRPIGDLARLAIEVQVLTQLGIKAEEAAS
jgi:hypothetical protein